MAITFTRTELVAEYPEFNATADPIVNGAIRDARALLGPEERWGSMFFTVLAAQTGELLSRRPFGMPARPAGIGVDGTSQSKYWRTIQDCKRRMPYRGLVIV